MEISVEQWDVGAFYSLTCYGEKEGVSGVWSVIAQSSDSNVTTSFGFN